MYSVMFFCICFIAVLAVVQSAGDAVAFTKGLVAHAHLTKGEIVTFNKDITNINAAFTSDGKFQAQVPGIYAFHFYALSRSDGEVWLEFHKNEQYLISIYAYTASDWADAGNSIILELQQGDTVFIKATDDYDNALYGSIGEVYTTFSGELLFSEKSGIGNPVAFTAALTQNISLTNGAHLVYDKVFTNAGNGYNANTGEFVAPVEGVYMIHYHSLAEQGEQMWLNLYHNDQYVNTAFGQAPNTWADAGNSAILELHAGDKLSIRSRQGENVVVAGQPDEVYSTFSAALLSPTLHSGGGGNGNGGVQAFSVGLSADADNKGTNSKVIFDRIFTNHGQLYQQRTGTFVAQVPGIYVFHFHALAQQDEEVWLELYHNYLYVNSLYGHATHGWAGGSNTATIELSVGDTVYVDMKNHASTLYGRSDEIYCTFSGYLLAPITKTNPVVGK